MFLTDDMSVLQAINSNWLPKLKALKNVYYLKTLTWCTLTLWYIEGNEQADRMAKLEKEAKQGQPIISL